MSARRSTAENLERWSDTATTGASRGLSCRQPRGRCLPYRSRSSRRPFTCALQSRLQDCGGGAAAPPLDAPPGRARADTARRHANERHRNRSHLRLLLLAAHGDGISARRWSHTSHLPATAIVLSVILAHRAMRMVLAATTVSDAANGLSTFVELLKGAQGPAAGLALHHSASGLAGQHPWSRTVAEPLRGQPAPGWEAPTVST